ncbi:radical SAM protein [Euryarchaeota archaeon SM23-78]|nr:MAG: radical SAM protein [Euryarchaeota archaeon SM23-78]
MAKHKKTKVEKVLYKKISRREFIKKAAIGVGAVCVGAYAISQLLKSPVESRTFSNDAPAELWKWSKEAYHYTSLGANVQCNVCPNQCFLEYNARSVCRVKVNKQGKLYTLAYGNPCAVHIDPIEKKPLYHFLPSTTAFSIATAGCTFRCLNCQNWQISQAKPEETKNYDLMPEQVVERAASSGCKSIAYTYSEPTAFYEYMYDSSKLARAQGIKNVWITNGSMNKDALLDFCQYLDGANVDLKSFDEDIYNKLNAGRLKPILETLKTLKEQGVWFEITNLIVPTWTDDYDMIKEMSEWIYKNIGPDYPVHFSRFNPMYKLTHLPPTPTTTLEKARQIALDAGIKHVYIGNVPMHSANNTYCSKCGKILIERKGYQVKQNNIESGACKFCGEEVKGVWL